MLTENNMSADCTPVDVAEAENAVLRVQESMQDLAVNVDLSNIQYNLDKLVAVAGEIGFDEDDFAEFHEDLKQSKCNAGMCVFDGDLFKRLDKVINVNTKNIRDKWKCHPILQKEDTPRVQFWWRQLPLGDEC